MSKKADKVRQRKWLKSQEEQARLVREQIMRDVAYRKINRTVSNLFGRFF